MEVIVNGDARQLESGSSVADLLAILQLKSKYVAVERNRELVPRARHAETPLADGDSLEVVTLVGGG